MTLLPTLCSRVALALALAMLVTVDVCDASVVVESRSSGSLGVRVLLDPATVEVAPDPARPDFHLVELPGSWTPIEGTPGHPALPILTVRLVLPPGERIADIQVTSRGATLLEAPIRPRPLTSSEGAAATPPAPEVYGSLDPFPRTVSATGSTGQMRGISIGTIEIQPFEYIGATGELHLHTDFVLDVQLEPLDPDDAVRERSGLRSRYSREAREIHWLAQSTINSIDIDLYQSTAGRGTAASVERPYGGFTPTEHPSTDGPPVEYVIITDDTALDGRSIGGLTGEFQRLADWKTSKGTPTVVRSVAWIRAHYDGHDDADRVRRFLIDAYQLWGTDYVLLGGDVDVVPARLFNGLNLGAGHPPVDAYYGGLDNDWDLDNDGVYGEFEDAGASDPYWDVWVGRAPVSSSAEATLFVDRALLYARAPGTDASGIDPAAYTRLILLEGLGNCSLWGQACNGLYVGETIARRMTPPSIQAIRVYQQLLDPSESCSYHETRVEVADSTQVPWTEAAAFATINDGAGFVHHSEHSNPYSEGGASGGFGCSASTGGALGREVIDQLTNAPNWPIVVSTGAGVNAFDYESVSEHWMLNPNGGAAAYIGKMRSGSPVAVTGEVDTLCFQSMFVLGANVGQTTAFSTQSSVLADRAVASFGLLGDPDLQPWTDQPHELELSFDPASPTLGQQQLEVSVLDAWTQAPLADARVCLIQGTTLYAVAMTDAAGTAQFGIDLRSTDDIVATVTGRNVLPVTGIATPIASAAPDVRYVDHSVRDDGPQANGNQQADAGEVIDLDVTVRNDGSAPITTASVSLRALGALTLDTTIDGMCSVEQIFVGAHGVHPADAACSLSFPALEFGGVDARGTPEPYATADVGGLFVWRDDDRWHLRARSEPGPVPGPTVIQGVLHVPGGITDPAAEGFEFDDSWTLDDAEHLSFQCLTQTPGDEDALTFRAGEALWMSAAGPPVPIGNLAPGESTTATLHLALSSSVPDRHAMRLELEATSGFGATVGRSEFSLEIAAPLLSQARQSVEGEIAPRGSVHNLLPEQLAIHPIIRNAGSGVANNVRVELTLISGQAVIDDGSVDVGVIPAGGDADARPDSFVVITDDPSTSTFTVHITNRYPDGTERVWTHSPVDLVPPCAPSGLTVEPSRGASQRLFFDPPDESCAADRAGFNVYRMVAEGAFELVQNTRLDSTLSFLDVLLPPASTIAYAVTTRDASGNESAFSETVASKTWIATQPGWPRAVNAGSYGSPTVIDLDRDGSSEILVVGNALYGWHHDGTPLIPGATDGIVFAPRRTIEDTNRGASGAFQSTPAAADLDRDGTIEIVVSAWDDSLWVLHADGTVLWGHATVSKLSSPVLGDIDGDGDLEVISGSDSPRLYAWHHDGEPVITGNADGEFAPLLDGAFVNYATPALADLDGDPHTEEVIHASFRGTVYAWNGRGELLVEVDVGPDRPLSTPAIGDMDGDGTLEIVVAQANQFTGPGANGLYVIDPQTNAVEVAWGGSSQIPGQLYNEGNIIHPPTLADFDDDGTLEIVVGTSGVDIASGSSIQGAATILVFDPELGTGSEFVVACSDTIPTPGLNMTNFSRIQTGSQPLVLDLDNDDALEVVVGSATFGLFVFEIAADLSWRSEPGWPMLFQGEVDATPYIGDVTGDGTLDMVVRTNAEPVTLFDLDAPFSPERVASSQFARDTRHTSNYSLPATTGAIPSASPVRVLRLAQNAPNPVRSATTIAYDVPQPGLVQLVIYGVDGRVVRALVDDLRPPGRHTVRWDGLAGSGTRAPAGVYFYRITVGSDSVARKLLLIR